MLQMAERIKGKTKSETEEGGRPSTRQRTYHTAGNPVQAHKAFSLRKCRQASRIHCSVGRYFCLWASGASQSLFTTHSQVRYTALLPLCVHSTFMISSRFCLLHCSCGISFCFKKESCLTARRKTEKAKGTADIVWVDGCWCYIKSGSLCNGAFSPRLACAITLYQGTRVKAFRCP